MTATHLKPSLKTNRQPRQIREAHHEQHPCGPQHYEQGKDDASVRYRCAAHSSPIIEQIQPEQIAGGEQNRHDEKSDRGVAGVGLPGREQFVRCCGGDDRGSRGGRSDNDFQRVEITGA